MQREDLVELDTDGSVAVLRLNDPGTLNGLTFPMLAELVAALDTIEAPGSGVRCAVLSGNGRGFCSGANLSGSNMEGVIDAEGLPDLGKGLDDVYHPVLRRLRDLGVPLITAVNGVAAGAGTSLAMMGDLILAARGASFVQSFRDRGLVPDCGATFLLPRLVGFGRALEFALLGERLSAERALEWGLVNRVYADEELMPQARKLAHELAAGPTRTLVLIRRAYWASRDNDFEAQLEVERVLQREAGRTQDFTEGVSAFFEKRSPRFRGK